MQLSQIKLDREVWPRLGYDEEVLERLVDPLERLPPVVVDQDGFLLDGWHRVERARRDEVQKIDAEVRDCEPEFRLAMAFALNNKHGLPVTQERRDVVLLHYHEAGLTQERIGELLGLSQRRVGQILGEIAPASISPEVIRQAIRAYESGLTQEKVAERFKIPRKTFADHFRRYTARKQAIASHLASHRTLTSVVSYAMRGDWGDSKYRGNCGGYLLVDLLAYFKPASVLDPMQGSGTTGDVAFDMGLDDYTGLDLMEGFDLVGDDLPDRQWDFIFWHPPYAEMIEYEVDHPNNLSTCKRADWDVNVKVCFDKLATALAPGGRMAILIGDLRRGGEYRPLAADFAHLCGRNLLGILIKIEHAERSKTFDYGGSDFIAIKHEYVVLYQAPA